METPTQSETLWISVQQLAKDNQETERVIYTKIYNGQLRHSRVGRRIKVRQCDWDELHSSGIVEPGEYKPDPVRQQAAIDRAAKKAEAA